MIEFKVFTGGIVKIHFGSPDIQQKYISVAWCALIGNIHISLVRSKFLTIPPMNI